MNKKNICTQIIYGKFIAATMLNTDFLFISKLHDDFFQSPSSSQRERGPQSSRVLIKECSITARNTLTNVRERIANRVPCRREDRARVDVGKCRGANVLEKSEVVVGRHGDKVESR